MRGRDLMKGFGQIQNLMAKLQKELSNQVFEGESGGGKVRVKVNGLQEVLEIKIDPEVVDPEDVEMLEDLILLAVRSALEKSRAYQEQYMQGIAASFGLSGLF